MIEIATGWRFYAADFSSRATGEDTYGTAMLVRSPEQTAAWFGMSEADQDDENSPPLFVIGSGASIGEAIADANKQAEASGQIPLPNDDAEGE